MGRVVQVVVEQVRVVQVVVEQVLEVGVVEVGLGCVDLVWVAKVVVVV